MSLSHALEPLVPTAVHLLLKSFDPEEGGEDGRGILAYLVRVLPLLNREARDLWRKERAVPQLLTLCDYLYGSTKHRTRYLDGVLPNADFDAEDWVAALDPSDMPNARPVLEVEGIHSIRMVAATGRGADAFMQTIVREHRAFMRHYSYHMHFGACQREGCTRPALLSPPEHLVGGVDDDDYVGGGGAAEYWKCCRDGNHPAPMSCLPSNMSFCCHGCYKATSLEFRRIVKFDIVTPPMQVRGAAGPSPAKLLRAAIKRNSDVARTMRRPEDTKTKHYPSTMANRERLLREQATMLSVDLGVLYAMSIVHQLPSTSGSKPPRELPSRDDWREHATSYLNAVCKVRRVYLKYGKGALSRGTATELWLRRLHDKALSIFV